MKIKHLTAGLVIFGVFTVSLFNYLSHKLDAKMQEENRLMQEKIDTEIVEAYISGLISKPIEI